MRLAVGGHLGTLSGMALSFVRTIEKLIKESKLKSQYLHRNLSR